MKGKVEEHGKMLSYDLTIAVEEQSDRRCAVTGLCGNDMCVFALVQCQEYF